MKFEKVSVVGLGYIGLPTAALFAGRKVKTIGVDIDDRVIEAVNRGEVHIVEPDLDVVVRATVTDGWLRATRTPEPSDAFLIAVPTPFCDGRQPDLSYTRAAAQAIAPVLEPGNLVILESTTPVGTTQQLSIWLAEARPDLTFPQDRGEASDIRVAHCPERVLPGQIMRELVQNDRVVGGLTPKCSATAVRLYEIFVEGECVVTDARTAEMCKLTENSFRDVNIAFANELSLICDREGIDVWELISLANRHPRVNVLQPGPGVGGHCIAVDPWFIVSRRPDEARIIRCAREVNDAKPQWVVGKIKQTLRDFLSRNGERSESDTTVACLGLAFKANVDDLRESPALDVAHLLAHQTDAKLLFVEPNIQELPNSLVHHEKCHLDEALKRADIIIVLVAHDEFKDAIAQIEESRFSFAAVQL